MLGKTNLSEWANLRSTTSSSGWSAVGGQVRNPHALDRNPCGSSSGSGAAVAASLAPAAIGTETDGSIVCPASLNGVVGVKPTVGLVSRARIVPIAASQDTAGPMTPTVRDAALNTAALRDAGAELVEIPESGVPKDLGDREMTILLAEFRHELTAYLATTPPAVRTRTLADLLAFDREHADEEMPCFGQELFEQAQATMGLDDPAYRRTRDSARRDAGLNGIDRLLREHRVELLAAAYAYEQRANARALPAYRATGAMPR